MCQYENKFAPFYFITSVFITDFMIKKRQTINVILITTGYILSPLSWWNDLVVNIPLAYLFSLPFSLIHNQLFIPSFIIGYWLSNLLGLLMMHWGGERLPHQNHVALNIKHSIAVSIIYSIIIVIAVMLGWLESPAEYLAYYR